MPKFHLGLNKKILKFWSGWGRGRSCKPPEPLWLWAWILGKTFTLHGNFIDNKSGKYFWICDSHWYWSQMSSSVYTLGFVCFNSISQTVKPPFQMCLCFNLLSPSGGNPSPCNWVTSHSLSEVTIGLHHTHNCTKHYFHSNALQRVMCMRPYE